MRFVFVLMRQSFSIQLSELPLKKTKKHHRGKESDGLN